MIFHRTILCDSDDIEHKFYDIIVFDAMVHITIICMDVVVGMNRGQPISKRQVSTAASVVYKRQTQNITRET